MNPQNKFRMQAVSFLHAIVLVLCAFNTATICHGEDLSNSVEVGVIHENLNQGFSDWQNLYLAASHKFAPRQTLYGEVHEAERFSQRDKKLVAGYYHPLGDKTTALIEAGVSPDHRFLPEWSLLGQFDRQLGAGWGLQLGFRHSEYSQSASDLAVLTAERYWSSYRAAYSLYVGKPEGAGSASSHRVAVEYFYADRNSVGIAFSRGKEVENVGTVITTNVRSIALTGRHWFTPTWSIQINAGWHEQGDLYVRKGVGLGIQHLY
jgi:YaiO family outer membrane protein